jgi:TonB family protein
MAPDGIFSSAYPDVKAPALTRQQLPREPAPGDDTGFFDMVIDEAGNVANIKLISPRRRYHDRMLVAAAKAWKFRPATLNGQPVKYRLRIPIILTGMP